VCILPATVIDLLKIVRWIRILIKTGLCIYLQRYEISGNNPTNAEEKAYHSSPNNKLRF